MIRDNMPLLLITAYVLGLFTWQIRRGVYREGIFSHSPARFGRLTLIDLAFGLILMVGGQMFGSMIALSLWGTPHSPRIMLLSTLIAELGSLLAALLIGLRIRQVIDGGLVGFGFRFDDFSRRLTTTIRVIAFVLPAAFLTLAAMAMLWKLFGGYAPPVEHPMLLEIRDSQSLSIKLGLIAVAVIIAPILEEFFFRGLVQTALVNSRLLPGRWAVIILASLLFATIHLGNVLPPALPGLFVLALGLGYVYERTGALWPSILLHMAFNAANIAAVLFHLVPG